MSVHFRGYSVGALVALGAALLFTLSPAQAGLIGDQVHVVESAPSFFGDFGVKKVTQAGAVFTNSLARVTVGDTTIDIQFLPSAFFFFPGGFNGFIFTDLSQPEMPGFSIIQSIGLTPHAPLLSSAANSISVDFEGVGGSQGAELKLGIAATQIEEPGTAGVVSVALVGFAAMRRRQVTRAVTSLYLRAQVLQG